MGKVHLYKWKDAGKYEISVNKKVEKNYCTDGQPLYFGTSPIAGELVLVYKYWIAVVLGEHKKYGIEVDEWDTPKIETDKYGDKYINCHATLL